ncbi:Predicted thiol-disulfide oxidoreductase YuxK, DCC family [Paenibacillaceae bacterium GAS479]|nr:Predicted thiol-disulfide oxidoreductase YuxK, DCC family [Paenibacillaceae bacterium GAS479]
MGDRRKSESGARFSRDGEAVTEHGVVKAELQPELTVLYDGQCRLCLAAVDSLQRLNPREQLRYTAVQEMTAQELNSLFRGAPPDALKLMELIHVVDRQGRVHVGSDAIIRAMRSVRGFGLAALLYRLPGMGRLADALYRYVAARRYDWFGSAGQGCQPDHCEAGAHAKPNDSFGSGAPPDGGKG